MYLLLALITLHQVTYASAIKIKNLLGKAAALNQRLPVEGTGHLFQSHHLLLPLRQHFPPSWMTAGAKSRLWDISVGNWEEEESAPMPTNNEMKCKAAPGYDIHLLKRDGCSAPSAQQGTPGRNQTATNFHSFINVSTQCLNNHCLMRGKVRFLR